MIFTFAETPEDISLAVLFSGGYQADFHDAHEHTIYQEFTRDFSGHRSPASIGDSRMDYPDFTAEAIDAAQAWLNEQLPAFIDVKRQFLRIMLEETGRQYFSDLLKIVGVIDSARLRLLGDQEALTNFFLYCAEFSWHIQNPEPVMHTTLPGASTTH